MPKRGENKRCHLISWEKFHADSKKLADMLRSRGFGKIMAVSRGGLFPAAVLAQELNLRTVETIYIDSFDGKSAREDVEHLKIPEKIGSETVIVDDLVDAGKTGKIMKELYPKAFLAVLYAKPEGGKAADLYVESFDSDVWIVLPWEEE